MGVVGQVCHSLTRVKRICSESGQKVFCKIHCDEEPNPRRIK